MKLAAVTVSNAQECVGKTRAHALLRVVEAVVNHCDEAYQIFHGRSGTVIIDGQPCFIHNLIGSNGGGIRSIEYGHERLIASFGLPYDRTARFSSTYYSMEALATSAIESLIAGRYLFEGQANRHLDSGIYHPTMPGKLHTIDVTGTLTVIEATNGRFLIGCSDSYMVLDKNSENEFIPITIARTLVHLYPADKELKRSYDWIKRNCGAHWLFINELEYVIDEMFSARHFCLEDFFKHIEEHPESLQKLPFIAKKRP